MEARDILVLAAKFTILSRSTRWRSASLSRVETAHEPGEFFMEAPPRLLHIDRIDLLMAVRHGPAHPRLGKEYSQLEARPVVLEVAVATEDPRNKSLASAFAMTAPVAISSAKCLRSVSKLIGSPVCGCLISRRISASGMP